MTLHILHAYKSYYPDEGGIPTVMRAITQGLCHETQQSVLCAKPGFFTRKDIIQQIPVERVGSWGEVLSLPISFNYPFAFWRAAKKVDIIDYHFPMPWVDFSVATYFPKKTKLVIHWHSDIVRQKQTAKWLSPIIDATLARADKIVVASPANITPRLAPYQNKCVTIPFGIDLKPWQDLSESDNQRILDYKNRFSRFVIGVGRLVSYKGFDILIKAMKNIDANLVIVGQGPLRQSLEQLSRECGVSHKVHWMGRVDDVELKALYHAAEIFAFPSVTENEAFGMVQLEAMACKKPVVNTSLNSGVPFVARHGQEALTVPPYDSAAFADAVNTLLSNAQLHAQLAQASLLRVNKEYTTEIFLKRTLALYRDV